MKEWVSEGMSLFRRQKQRIPQKRRPWYRQREQRQLVSRSQVENPPTSKAQALCDAAREGMEGKIIKTPVPCAGCKYR